MNTRVSYPIGHPLHAEPDLQILGMGIHETQGASIVHRPLGVEGYLLTFFHSDALVRLQGVEHRLPPSSLVIWKPGQRQCYGHDGGRWDHSWLHCNGVWIFEQFGAAQIPQHTVLHLDNADETDNFFRQLHQACNRYPQPSPEVVRHIITLWLAQLRCLLRDAGTQHGIPADWLEVKQYIDTHFAEPLTRERLAEQLSVSVPHFSRMFKQYFELPAIEYLKQVRMEHARFLLHDQNLSVADIGQRVGFDDYRHFSTQFFQYFGVRPLTMRKGMSGDSARARLAEKRRELEFSHWTREGWTAVYHADFAATTDLSAWQIAYYRDHGADSRTLHLAPYLAEITDGCLHLRERRNSEWTAMQYIREIGEDTKIAIGVRNTPPDGPNIALAVSGDLRTGYRLRILGYYHVTLETVQQGYWELLYQCPVALDPHADAYTITLWRSDNVFYAEIDGELILSYPEPFAAQGAAHRTVGLGRFGAGGDMLLQHIRLWTRRSPRYVDILEPGRVLLRHNHHQEAQDWFRRIAEEQHEVGIQREAAYLAALAIPEDAGTAKDTALCQVVADSANPFHTRALRELILHRVRHHDRDGALESARSLQAISPDDGVFPHLAQLLIHEMQSMPLAEQDSVLAQLAQFPINVLDFFSVPLVRLTSLRGMQLASLTCGAGFLDDLSPLAGMPLTTLVCMHNQVTELTPLTGMALRYCDFTMNAITDLSPLTGMPLTRFSCRHNTVHDLTPLAGMPLVELSCTGNQVRDLAPLATLPLQALRCAGNRIHDLRPLAGLPLEFLDCSANPVDDFSVLAPGMLQQLFCTATGLSDLRGISHHPLTALGCGWNGITDLAPLADMPLWSLHCAGNPVTDLTPLAHLPLTYLSVGSIPLDDANTAVLAGLPLRELVCDRFDAALCAMLQAHPTLQNVNSHTRAHVLAVMPALHAALAAWRNDPVAPMPNRYALRAFAEPVGDRLCLSLPMALPWPEALAFCQWQGGTLACPDTEVYYTILLHYLRTVVRSDYVMYHLLGMQRNSASPTLRRLSDTPYPWQHWLIPAEHDNAFPRFISNTRYSQQTWWSIEESVQSRGYVVMEWDQ